MKKIINKPEDVVDQMIDGLIFGSEDLIERIPGTNVVLNKRLSKGKVAFVSGGGSGHEPTHAGFVGQGIGGKILDYLENEARKMGYVRWGIYKINS
ncbi:dihydroxyacetone kinase subunit DhaK [Sporolactobacillus pectinivorans]|uniref:dihydroxyacetone kinase subunit DhaK n=1 Tax=Sporolactobacillus pectinivorans TaxID=1591408 RepID=UPI000C25C47B|nr:dihydroxyacetone kinase subunit DhaK [Sporolactobacillus pectinivorans]